MIMGVVIGDNKLVIITESKTICFDLSKYVGKNLKDEIDFTIKHNEILTQHKIKNKISPLLFRWKQCSWTQKTVKLINHPNLFLNCVRD